MSTVRPIIEPALYTLEVIWSSQFSLSERERCTYPKHNQLWHCSDECCVSAIWDTQRNDYPITQRVLSFTHKHSWIITRNLTKDRVCLWSDPDSTTTSICQQTISIILWITSLTQLSAMPHVPNTTIDSWPKPRCTTCWLEVCKGLKTLSAYLWFAASIQITSVSRMGTYRLMWPSVVTVEMTVTCVQ